MDQRGDEKVMKADHKTLMKAAELGIMRSLPDFLAVKPKMGRLRRRFEEVGMIVDFELKKMYSQNNHLFTDNKDEMAVYLEKFGKIMGFGNVKKKTDIHVASIISFCLCFLENTQSNYPAKLSVYLQDMLDYYERADNMKYSDFTVGVNFNAEWEKLKQ